MSGLNKKQTAGPEFARELTEASKAYVKDVGTSGDNDIKTPYTQKSDANIKKYDIDFREVHRLRMVNCWCMSKKVGLDMHDQTWTDEDRKMRNSFGTLDYNRMRHVRSGTGPIQKYPKPIATSQDIGWHSELAHLQPPSHPMRTSPITKYAAALQSYHGGR